MTTIEDAWTSFKASFDKYAPLLGCNKILRRLGETGFSACPNLLLYSPSSFPIELIWTHLLHSVYGPFTTTVSDWEKDLIFSQSQYHFEINMALPTQTKNFNIISSFIKHVVSHKCIHNDRHIIVLSSIDRVFAYEGATQAFKVLLERFSSNAIFICTTDVISQIEKPIVSRFVPVRVPCFTEEHIDSIFADLNIPIVEVPPQQRRNIIYRMFAAYIPTKTKTTYVPHIRYGFLVDYFGESRPTIDQLRSLTQKLHSLDIVFSDLILDLTNILDVSKREAIIQLGAHTDHCIAQSNCNRKALYIEYFLNAVNKL